MTPTLAATLVDGMAGGMAVLHGRERSLHLSFDRAPAGTGRGLAGACVLLRTHSQLAAARGLIGLDGLARRIVIAPPDLKEDHLPSVIARAQVDAVAGEDESLAVAGTGFVPLDDVRPRTANLRTEWVMFTSGTTGVPKMVAHTLAGLTGAIRPGLAADTVWGTFYDIRRYGGLQILLRALFGHAPLVLSDAAEPVADFLARLGRHGVTHLTGTPSHWRRVLMSPANVAIAPRYVRLSGEIADQAILDALKARFPDAAIGHAYASTEAGVGFEVTDGLEGFPADLVDGRGAVRMTVRDGRLHLCSPRAAGGYVGAEARALAEGGWVDSGDMVERRGGRYYFMGRSGGIINVGGLKINPEEVEAVINRQPGVRASRVYARKNPITGAIVAAEVVAEAGQAANDNTTFRDAILAACREVLPPFKVPAMLRFVPSLALTAGGKLQRHA